ncbi:glycosyltransferase family 9 protein [Flammeovirga sp. EKP202]|uniref:glycosyltransferase family 9 protein n=1 Tax=Flammeovirga sp. EKP202 TaxID=2770592 RepID=UPI00165F1B44|nr:glycosyltransferase family 9 protein [Flammeovirga sp. EKP202]MBD0403154.1 glycosyltransferase family 9 protein [Flammeovirga sp. EKP202]
MRIQGIDNIVIIGSPSMKEFAISLPIVSTLLSHNSQLRITWIGTKEQKILEEYINDIHQFLAYEEVDDDTLVQNQAALFLSENKELSKKCRDLKIEMRIGTKSGWRSNRRFTNSIDTEQFSTLEECYHALLTPLGINEKITIDPPLTAPVSTFRGIIKKDLKNIVFYPYRLATHRVWPSIRYFELIEELPKYENNYIIAGNEMEGKALEMTAPELFRVPSVKNSTDLEDLEETLALIAKSDVLVTYNNDIAHLAHAMGSKVICISSSAESFYINKEMSPIITPDASCIKCVEDKPCECLRKLGIDEVVRALK